MKKRPAVPDADAKTARLRMHPLRTLALTAIVIAIDGVLLALALGGFGALLGHPRAIALLVIWAVHGILLAFMRPVRSQDTVRNVADAPLVMAVLFFVPLLGPPVSAFGERAGVWPVPWSMPEAPWADGVAWAGVVLVMTGLVIRTASMACLGNRFSPKIAVQRGHALETAGLYARVRHPGYLGALMATLGGVLAFTSMLAWPVFVLMVIAQAQRARREEGLLVAHFGPGYEAYRRRTGMFLPRVRGPRA